MATKIFCDVCRTEIKQSELRPLKYGDWHIDLCPVCAKHFERWLDGDEKMVDVMEGDGWLI